MSLSALIATSPMGIPVSKTCQPSSHIVPASVRLGLKRAQDHLWLSWLVAVTACFLAVGVAGLFENEDFMPILLSGTKGEGAGEVEAMQAVMMDIQTESVATETAVEETVDVVDVPPPVEIMEQPQDLPELAEALITEDVFVIPTPPRIENVLRPIDPVQPRPQPKPQARPAPQRTVARAAISRSSGSSTTAGGSGGPGNAGVAASRGTFVMPKPSYPSSLKAIGVQGTVRLSITFDTSGRPESVSVADSSGNSTLDQHAASWARRNWRGPSGVSTKVIAPLSFVLH